MRRFLVAVSLFALSWLVAGCSEDEVAKPAPRVCTNAVPAVVSVGGSPSHDHIGDAVCEEDRGAGVEFTMGTAHVHTVSLTPQDVVDALDGIYVSKTSSSAAGHVHLVRFNP